MPSKELLEKMKQHYSEARHLAKELSFHLFACWMCEVDPYPFWNKNDV